MKKKEQKIKKKIIRKNTHQRGGLQVRKETLKNMNTSYSYQLPKGSL